jgi:hypothetical protein
LFKESLLEVRLGGVHFLKCLVEGLHVFGRHCRFGHGRNGRISISKTRPLFLIEPGRGRAAAADFSPGSVEICRDPLTCSVSDLAAGTGEPSAFITALQIISPRERLFEESRYLKLSALTATALRLAYGETRFFRSR